MLAHPGEQSARGKSAQMARKTQQALFCANGGTALHFNISMSLEPETGVSIAANQSIRNQARQATVGCLAHLQQ